MFIVTGVQYLVYGSSKNISKNWVLIMQTTEAKSETNVLWSDKKRTLFGLPISFTKYMLTERKLIIRKGFLSIVEDEIELYRILDKSLKLPLGQRMFGCGTVIVNSRDVNVPKLEVKSIKKPREFMTILEEYVDKQRDKYGTRGRDMIGSAPHRLE